MPSPRRVHCKPAKMAVRAAGVFSVVVAGLLANPQTAKAQIASVTNSDGRRMFVNAEPIATVKLLPVKPRTAIYLPGEISFMGENRPAMNIDRDGGDATSGTPAWLKPVPPTREAGFAQPVPTPAGNE